MVRDLAILIGTYNRAESLARGLAAISKLRSSYSIHVADGGSTDGTIKMLSNRSDIDLLKEGALLGQAVSLNRLLTRVDSRYVCWLSDDNEINPAIVDIAVQTMNKSPQIGLLALKVKDVSGHNAGTPYIGGIWSSGILNVNQGLMPTRLLSKLGGFDEVFRDYGMDAELTTRVLLAGYQVAYTKEVAVFHYREEDVVSWVESFEERKRRMIKAKELYKERFAAFLPLGDSSELGERTREAIFRLVDVLYRVIFRQQYGSYPKLFGVTIWDWLRVLRSRYISVFDLLLHRGNDFYLVQRIPEALRTKGVPPCESHLRANDGILEGADIDNVKEQEVPN